MGRVFDDRDGASLGELAEAAVHWVRLLRQEGAQWTVLPTPSRPELYPHMRFTEDAPWHAAKREIGAALAELTLLPRMNPRLRRQALERGLDGWTTEGVSALALGIANAAGAAQCDAVLGANRSTEPVVLPQQIVVSDASWRTPE